MAIHQDTLDRAIVMHALDETVHTLERDDSATRSKTCDALGIGTADWEACRDQLIEELQEAEDWVERERTIVEAVEAVPPIDSQQGPEFVPSHATLALFQSAMNEHLDDVSGQGFQPSDIKWLSVLYQRLRAQVRGKVAFVQHTGVDDFRFTLGERSTVALVSDWGTGNAHAAAVASQISHRDPDHVIHLGDVYYSGTPREMRSNFLDMWRVSGPRRARYWALNGNHDMYSGGYGFFEHVLPAFKQPSSYFNLQNRFWRLIGLDSAYVNHNFTKPQMTWFQAQLAGAAKTLLLTHHHLFSGFRKRGDKLEEWLNPYLTDGRLYGWFWGHDHYLIEYANHRGLKCRCIGHGSLPYVPPDRQKQTHPAQIVRMETRSSPLTSSRGIHGFALLTFDGPALHIEYIDEEGGTSWTERWE
jgi:predicted phosphodiesterase